MKKRIINAKILEMYMKKIKSVAIDAKDKTIKYLKKVKREHLIKKYFKHNVI